VETEKNRDKSSNCDSYVTCVDVHCFLQTVWELMLVLCDLHLKRFDLTKGLSFDTFFSTVWYKLCYCDH